ncbi:T9SS type B sorting domain-containing protein [Mangrovimonas cancribranchiae]|uniref:T9SS type B sorting domain-containing protein n=1 Tax=Mangrovimonas cancribranchiae TaxID=3080055 RepID=A0AAU6P1X6_9FLAO
MRHFILLFIFLGLWSSPNQASNCPDPIITSFSPTSGPENTSITISGNNFNATANVTIGGISTSYTIIDDTTIIAFIPNGANGLSTISITSNGGCVGNSTTDFDVITSECNLGDLYISEIYDSEPGSYGIIELYNPTNTSISLDGVYDIERYGDIGNPTPSITVPLVNSVAPQQTYIIQMGTSGNACAITPDTSVSTGFNDNDEFKLLKNGTVIDVVEAPNERGYSIIRNANANEPQVTFNSSNFTINLNESCSNVGFHTADPITDNTPAIANPVSQTVCENGSLTFSTSINNSIFQYQWKVLDASGNWIDVPNNANYSNPNEAWLDITNVPLSFDGNQYYCEVTSASCILVTSVAQLHIDTPEVDTLSNQTVCQNYTLPALTDGDYFTGTNGTGTQLNAGDVISTSQTVYIYNQIGTPPNTCSNESSFEVIVSGTPNVDTLPDQTVCQNYTLPALTDGDYFTGTNGTGMQLNAGDVISTSQTIYIFNQIGTPPNTCSNESSFEVIVSGTPNVDTLPDQTVCQNYTLPALTDGDYFTGTNGTGMQLNAGDVISTSQTIYIFNQIGTPPNTCSNESSFEVIVSGTPNVDTLPNQTVCQNYTLPALTDGNYFTGTNGTGMQLNAGDVISTSQTIYIFNQIGTPPNTCSNESSFEVIVSGTPNVDTLPNQTVCQNYTLPALTDGNYFTGTNGTGTQLNAGDVISTSQTIYIFNQIGTPPNTCSNESSFEVIVSGTPNVDTLPNQTVCQNYTLPALTDGDYFTGTNGTGMQLNAGDVISTSQTIYIFNQIGTPPNTCSNESSFEVIVSGTPNVDTLPNQTVCQNYTLPALTDGNYFTGTNGTGTQLNAGDVISTSQTIYIFNQIGTPPNTCSNESSFEVTILPSIDFQLTENNLIINENALTVVMTNTSITYEFAIDNNSFQSNNNFTNLSEGFHTLYVQDSYGCIIKSINFDIETSRIETLDIPPFFTPNGDSYNDVWQISDPNNTIKEVYIFNRFGKLLKQVSTSHLSWDGTYNGNILETNDYWYLINLKSGIQIKGHFTLKR